MLSSYPDRFTASASALNEHYPTVQKYLVDFSTLTARCTQQGLLINRIQINLNTFAGVDQLINVAQFELPEETTNLTDLFHSAFDLPQEERNARLEELFEQDEALLNSMNINSNELTNRHRATVDIIAQLDQAITLSEGLHDTTITCMAEGVTLASVLPGNRDGVESWTQSIQAFDILLQDSGTALCALHHKCSMAALEMLTCLSSMATYPNIVQWRRMEFSRKRDENHRNNRNWVQRERMNPNANHWHLASPTDIANLKRQGAANRQGNRGQNPSAPLEPFHGLPVPYLAIAPHANPTQLDHFVSANPAFDFGRVVKNKGAGWLHRAYIGKDIPIKVTWYGWPSNMDDRQITTLIYSLGLPILSSPVFPRKKGAIPLCSLVYKTMTNGLWDCLSRRGGFINDVPMAIKVAVGTKDTTLGAYHIWATLSGSGHTFAPREYPHAFQAWVYQQLGINLLISPQTLLPNWLTAACHNGRWELALQNPADIQQLVKLLDLPLLLEELTGRGTIDPANLLIGKLRLKEGQGRYALELICLPSGVDQGTLERFLGQKEIDYSGLQARPNSGATVTWTIGFDDNLLRTEASKQLGNAIVPHLSNRPLRINVKQLTMPRGMCNICFHESNSLDNMRHMWRDCPNRRNVCTVCHKDSHTTNECGYVDALVEYEPETQEVPDPVRRGNLTAHNLQSRADRRERQQQEDEQSRQSRRTLMSQTARAKKLYSSSEDDESDGELAANPEWSATAASAGGPSQPSAFATPAWTPPPRFTPQSSSSRSPWGRSGPQHNPYVRRSTPYRSPNPPPRRSTTPPAQYAGATVGLTAAATLPSPPLPRENTPPPPSPLHAPPSPSPSDRSTTSNKRSRSDFDTPESRAAEVIAEEAAAAANTPIHHNEAQDEVDEQAMEEEGL